MDAIKDIIEKLQAGYFLMGQRIADADRAVKDCAVKEKKLNDELESIKAKIEELSVREAKIKHIESIDEANKAAIKNKAEAVAALANLEGTKEAFEKETKSFAAEKARLLKEVDDAKIMNKKQADALIAERKEFEAKMNAFKAVKSVM